MPIICRFFGIIIAMYYQDHNPPHFHVQYNEHQAIIELTKLGLIKGYLPPKVFALVIEWAC